MDLMSTVDGSLLRQDRPSAGGVAAGLPSLVRVLAVDDERASCKLLSLMLRAPAYCCTTAASGEEALVALQTDTFEAVISDLEMPGISGLALLAHVRRVYPYTAFLVTTGVDDVDVGVQAMRSGADDYLVKPLHENAVLASLESALHKRYLERQVENYRQHLEDMVAQRTGQLRTALQQIERSYEDTLQALAAAIDLRDNETAGHSERVAATRLRLRGPWAGRRVSWAAWHAARISTILESSEFPMASFSSRVLSPRKNAP